ncbi:AEC family transporter [Dyadobacter tibetensis]|uniref:AEC family transporter n=1 Tax=Dyadobacter tibetensis TaxID=1211851 RepID=UPI0004727035|nr:AEC family transporter [Dyadobacter tibetensis]
MSDALQKTITLLLIIVLGLLLKNKFTSKEQTNGLKEIILSVALPATIFISLMKIEIDSTMIVIPVLMLVFNIILYLLTPLSFTLFGIDKDSQTGRTMMMLIPSLAPGLSCFPFIAEFLGDKSLAIAALADVGNKIFVLITLYIVALNMYLKNNNDQDTNTRSKVTSLLSSMFREPINILMIAALIMLSIGINYSTLPAVITDLFNKTSAMMTPLVLLFIGLAVQLREGRKRTVASMLFFRAGISLLISSGMIFLLNINDTNTILLATVLPLSAVSFWPLAHISAFTAKEDQKNLPKEKRTFDTELAVLLLAFSLPFSTLLILGLLSSGTYFANLHHLIISGFALLGMGALPQIINKVYLSVSKA